MLVNQISFYQQFHCANSSCPDPCCRGWKIPLDDETLLRFHNKGGWTGFRLISSLRKEDGLYLLNAQARTCPFFTREKLCSLQLKEGPDFIPLVCQRYPRRILNYGAFVEQTLELACPVVSNLFLENYRNLHFVSSSFDASQLPNRYGTNEDYTFLAQLQNFRTYLCDLASRPQLSDSEFFSRVIALGRAAQNACISGDFSFFDQSSFDFSNVDNFSFSGETVDLFFTTGLYHIKLKGRNPKLYELCQLYFNTYDSFSSLEASTYFSIEKAALLEKYPNLFSMFRAYFVYYLQSSFLSVFESYSFLKVLTLGLVHLHLLELFFTLHVKKYGSLTQSDQAQIISSYEKRARHNEEITDSIYAAIYKFLP